MKKAEISNQTLGILLVAAIALSLIGTFVTVTKVGQQPTIRLVGYAPATDTGTALVNLTVDQILDINFTTAGADFGVGSITPGAVNCTKVTSGLGAQMGDGAANCTQFTPGSIGSLVIENIGNVNVTLNLSFNQNAASMIGGTSPAFEIAWTCNEAGSVCRNTTGNNMCTSNWQADQNIAAAGGSFLQTAENAWTVLTTVNASATNDFVICPNFDYAEASDTINLDFLLTLPADSFTGNLSTTVTATAYIVEAQQ